MLSGRYIYVGGGLTAVAAIVAAWIAIGVGGGGGGGSTTTCPAPRFPDLTCVGVPSGTVLTTYSGPNPITADNAVVDGVTFPDGIEVRGSNVTIRNSKVEGTVANVDQDSFGKQPLILEDSEVDCGGLGGSGIVEANITIRRVWVHGCENGLSVDQNIDMRDTLIGPLLDLGGTEAHEDGVQFACGHWDPTYVGVSCSPGYAPGTKNITFIHNTILSLNAHDANGNVCDSPPLPETCFTTSAIISNKAGNEDTNVLIQGNLLAGAGFTIYCDQNTTGNNYRVLDNHFSTRFKATVGYFGPSTDCSDETQSGNVIHETGAPITLG